jgi:hypothetical protein
MSPPPQLQIRPDTCLGRPADSAHYPGILFWEKSGQTVLMIRPRRAQQRDRQIACEIPWPRNVLRHSFINYRIAIVKSADQVALEAGNSPSIIFKNYRELTTDQEAEKWFGILPKEGQWENRAMVSKRKRGGK